MAKRDIREVVGKAPVIVDGRKQGTDVTFSDGEVFTLLNPHGKGAKYAAELKSGVRITNDGNVKKADNGDYMGLSDTQAAWRGGYLQARKDSARAYNATKGKGGKR